MASCSPFERTQDRGREGKHIFRLAPRSVTTCCVCGCSEARVRAWVFRILVSTRQTIRLDIHIERIEDRIPALPRPSSPHHLYLAGANYMAHGREISQLNICNAPRWHGLLLSIQHDYIWVCSINKGSWVFPGFSCSPPPSPSLPSHSASSNKPESTENSYLFKAEWMTFVWFF